MMSQWKAKAEAYRIAREALRKAMETDMLLDVSDNPAEVDLVRHECEYILEFVIDAP